MNDKNIKKKLNNEDTVGFGEFADEYEDELSGILPKTQQKRDAVSGVNNLLVRDHDRLLKIKKLLASKMPFIRKYPHSNSILAKLESENSLLVKNAINQIKRPDSSFLKNIDLIWKKAFKLD